MNVKLTTGTNELVIITRKGMSIRFAEDQLRDQGRVTRGVKGITLKKGDYVQAMEVVNDQETLLIAGEKGIGKRSSYEEYRSQNRAGSGIIAIRTEAVTGALSVHDTDEIMMLTHSGQAVRSPVKDIRVIGRTTQGVKLINLAPSDRLVGISKVVEGDEEGTDNNNTSEEPAGELAAVE